MSQVDEAEQEHVAKMLPSLPCIHPFVALQWWLLHVPCYGAGGALQPVLWRMSDSLLGQTSSDSYSDGASFSLGGWFGKQGTVESVAAKGGEVSEY